MNDGYNRRISFPDLDLRVIYRPALQDERRRFRYDAAFLDSPRFCHQWILKHLVFSNPAKDWLTYLEWMWGRREDAYQKLFLTIQGLLPDDSGIAWKDLERPWADNLREGLELELTNPRLARRSCDECKKWWYSEQTGLVLLNGDGAKLERFGPTLCQTTGCAKGTPDQQKCLNKANKWAWRHFRDCDAVGQFPDDPIVRRNAAMIRQVMNTVANRKAVKQ